MHAFSNGQRVKILKTAAGIALGKVGTVARMRRDGGAWIALDRRSRVPGVHPFPADDAYDRSTHVMAYPEDCEPAKTTAKERRKADRSPDGPVPVAEWGKDHWSTFGYLVTLQFEGGKPDLRRMRCDASRHPHLGRHPFATTEAKYPTRLRGDVLRANHDDWDCADDLVAAGFFTSDGDLQEPAFLLTEAGLPVSHALMKHKANGGNFAEFTWPPKSVAETAAPVHSQA